MKLRALVLCIHISLGFVPVGFAMEPFVPETHGYASAGKEATLTIRREGWKATLTEKGGKSFAWPGEVIYPSRAVLAPRHRYVILLGGLGDSTGDLGLMQVYSFEGKRLAELNVGTVVPNLKALSESFTRKAGPSQWLGTIELDAAETVLRIAVCNKVPVTLKLDGLQLSAGAPAK